MTFTKHNTAPTSHKTSKQPKRLEKFKTHLVPGVPVGPSISFGSRVQAPYNKLSNFNACYVTGTIYVLENFDEFVLKEYTFPSSEHFYWAHYFVKECDIERLAVGGDLASLETGLPLLVPTEKLEKYLKCWQKNDNVGIVAKMLYGKSHISCLRKAADLGMTMGDNPIGKYGKQGADSTRTMIWTRVLVAKFTQNIDHRHVLLGTRDNHLVNITRTPLGEIYKDFFSGRVVDGKLYGRNYMGDCMMEMRDTLMYSV